MRVLELIFYPLFMLALFIYFFYISETLVKRVSNEFAFYQLEQEILNRQNKALLEPVDSKGCAIRNGIVLDHIIIDDCSTSLKKRAFLRVSVLNTS